MTPDRALELGLWFRIIKGSDQATIWAYSSTRESSVGTLTSQAQASSDPCGGAWEIVFSRAMIDGLGPLMYDLMIDLISPHPLMSDRIEVSRDAKRVWDYYRDRRGDIEQVQLDDNNCYQKSAKLHDKGDWASSSLSKAYRRRDGGTPTYDRLKQLGLIK